MSTNHDKDRSSLRILLTGGRAPVTLDLARQLQANGHSVFVAESCPVHLCRHSRSVVRSYSIPAANQDFDGFITSLIDIIQKEHIDCLIPTCEEVFFIARGCNRLNRYCRVFVDSYEQLKLFHNKWSFIQYVQSHLLSAPETHRFTDIDSLKSFLLSSPGKWVLKPVYSRFSSRVVMIEVDQEGDLFQLPRRVPWDWEGLLTHVQPINKKTAWIAQEFIEGKSYCSFSLAMNGRITAHAVYPVDFTAGTGACISFMSVRHPEIDDWVKRFVERERFTGAIAFDFIQPYQRPIYPIECNPRMTSGLHLFQTEDRLDQAFLCKTNPTIRPDSSHKRMISLAMLSYGLFSIRSWKQAKSWLKHMIQGKDVLFQWSDPQPSLQQIRYLWWCYQVSRREKISIMESSTYDIEWNGEE